MTTILVPYHLDEHLPDLDVPIAPQRTLTADLPDADTWQRMGALHEVVAAAVRDVVDRGGVPVVLSGDCTVSFGIMAGLQRAGVDPAVVWLDAHGDVQTLETTASGYLGGMPLRVLVGYRPELIADRLGLAPVAEDRVVLVDARDLDPPELDYLNQARIVRASVAQLAQQEVAVPDGPLYLHFDADIIDPGDLPGLLYPAPHGPRMSDVVDLVERLIGTGRVVAVCVGCTWHPQRGASQALAAQLIPALQPLLAGGG